MRRTLFAALLFGLLIAVIPAGPAAAARADCGKNFPTRLGCWQDALDDGAVVTVTLNKPLGFDAGQKGGQAAVRRDLKNLRVQVPAGVHTGQGGSALLILAGRALVDRDARIDRLDDKTLRELPACVDDLCKALKKSSLTGGQLIDKKVGVAELGGHRSTDHTRVLLIALTAVLLLLLLALLLAVRRSRTPAVAGATETTTETTARLRPVPPAPAPASYGRQVGPRPDPSRTAVVRTALHPQGYVELDHVLYRAVWAEPDRTPPVPGAYVEVTDAHEPDSDVLYAFPPVARHHARGSS
ncbi:hypothetical protein OG194_16700 [Streptomyces sp. NBC_01288]|uniref:hypothetical protein n=1 Tax=Streptomyces sp. NBC_01288 TaxID=2903814 RepID=UPI002E114904|nr:hypothetical protein OG194_16700 [Streptomyces sp. NBC_01288]